MRKRSQLAGSFNNVDEIWLHLTIYIQLFTFFTLPSFWSETHLLKRGENHCYLGYVPCAIITLPLANHNHMVDFHNVNNPPDHLRPRG